MVSRGWIAAACAAIAGALALPAPAEAHVTLQPDQAPAKGFVVENVRVPNEQSSASTIKVSVKLPAGFADVSYEPVPGWKVAVKKTKLAQPITTDEGNKLTEQVSLITWSGGKIAPGQFQDFPLSMQMPDKAGSTLTFKALQIYDNGKVVRWIGPPDAQEPAPPVKVTRAAAETAATTPAVSSSDKEDSDSKTLPIIALIVGALGLLAGGAALLSRRRAA